MRGNRLRRAALVLALLVLAAIVTGVAASATTTAIPKQLTGRWERNDRSMRVYSFGEVPVWSSEGRELGNDTWFSRVTAHRLTIRGGICSGTGTYRWTTIKSLAALGGAQLKLKKIHDACEARVNLFVGTWWRPG
jgi:hypothetical protein